MENQKQLTTNQVATFLNCTVQNVILHYKKGNLKGQTKANGKYLFFKFSDVLTFKTTYSFRSKGGGSKKKGGQNAN